MLLLNSILILLSSAVTFRRDKALSFNRITIIILLYTLTLGLNSLYIIPLETGIGIYGGLYQVTALTQTFVVFICILTVIILQLSSFYYRHLWYKSNKYEVYSSFKESEKEQKLRDLSHLDILQKEIRIIEYPVQQCGKLLSLREKLSNSGNALKLFIPNQVKLVAELITQVR